MPLEITNIGKVENVLQGKKICEATEDELKDKIKIIYLMIGLRPQHFPVDEEKTFLHNYIYSKYGNKTLNELVLAFDLAIQGQLPIDDAKVYDQFTCEYLAKIMNGYRLWLLSVVKNSSTIKSTKVMQVEDKKELTDQEWEEWIEDIKKYPLDLIPNHLYEYLERKGRISLNNEQKHELMGKAINFVLNKLQDREFSEFLVMKNNGIFTGNYPAMLKTISKKMAVKNYFDEKSV